MPTLQELIETNLGFGEEKTASVADSSDELDRLAEELGLFDKVAGEDKEVKEEKEEEEEKKASAGELDSLYESLFPEDGMLSKTAEEEEKIAYEQELGARAYDYMTARWDARIEKLAAEVLSGGATISASTAAEHDGNPHKDPTIAQAQKTNRPANASDKIDTTPVYTDEVKKMNDARTVGDYEQKHAAVKQAALRKAFILSSLED
jgi:hypothetical protein